MSEKAARIFYTLPNTSVSVTCYGLESFGLHTCVHRDRLNEQRRLHVAFSAC